MHSSVYHDARVNLQLEPARYVLLAGYNVRRTYGTLGGEPARPAAAEAAIAATAKRALLPAASHLGFTIDISSLACNSYTYTYV